MTLGNFERMTTEQLVLFVDELPEPTELELELVSRLRAACDEVRLLTSQLEQATERLRKIR
jgi:hypothetical protein